MTAALAIAALFAASLPSAVQADGDWQPMPAEGEIPPLLFGCFTQADGFYDLYLYRNGDGDHLRIGHEPPGRGPDAYRRIVLRGAFQSAARVEAAEGRCFRLEYLGNDGAGVPTRLTVVMSAPQLTDANGVRTATFTLVRADHTVTQSCLAAPPPPEVPQ